MTESNVNCLYRRCKKKDSSAAPTFVLQKNVDLIVVRGTLTSALEMEQLTSQPWICCICSLGCDNNLRPQISRDFSYIYMVPMHV
jgi:hypothetical protein